jgi:hypothetical protein
MKDVFDRTRCQLFLCLMVLVGPISAGDKIGETVGLAYDLKTDELLYSETHCVSEDSAEREVLYKDVDGELMTSKLLDYSSGVTTPSFVQHNLYSSEFIEVGFEQGMVSMTIIDADSREILKSAQAQPSQKLPIVIDAGFDSFVRQYWDSLVAGESHEFQFPLADRESLVELRIQSLGCSYASQTDQCFRLDVANLLLRILVKPIELGYDKEARRLTRFRGLSNIGDANGNGLVVDIKYDHRDSNPEICRNISNKNISNNSGQTSSTNSNSRATELIARRS